jgi:hypothetical protein
MELSSPEKLAVMSETKKNLAQSEFINLKTLQLKNAAVGEASARMRAELVSFKELASVYAEGGVLASVCAEVEQNKKEDQRA